MHCEDIELLPRELTITRSRDTRDEKIDVHTFSKFFTYQIPTEEHKQTNIVTQRFKPTSAEAASSNYQSSDLVMRLRASLKSANMDNEDQGMKVTVFDEQDMTVIVDASTEDHDERSVHLDSVDLSSKKTYLIQYQFFEKNLGLRSFEDKSVSSGHMGASACSKPFVVSELVIAEKELIHERSRKYNEVKNEKDSKAKLGGEEHQIDQMSVNCNFTSLDNSQMSLETGEAGLYCPRRTYTYKTDQYHQSELNTVFTKEFSVIGAQNEAVTYLFDMTLGFDFASSAQLRAVLQRVNPDHRGEFQYDPLKCLWDHSCVTTQQLSKNEIGISVILTPGDYQLTIFDQEENALRRWLDSEVGLKEIPFSFELQATPVVQNEERVMCGNKLYLSNNFIQNRFIDHKGGQKFIFEDDVVLNLVNSTQSFDLVLEEEMVLKITAKEAYGINVGIKICQKKNCDIVSQKDGNMEQLFALLRKNEEYTVVFDYSHSIVELSSFYDCPHMHILIAMMSEDDANAHVKAMDNQSDKVRSMESDSNENLGVAFNMLTQAATMNAAAFMISGTEQIYEYALPARNQVDQIESHVLTEGQFTIPDEAERQILIEIFYEPQFYDLEILLESSEAKETRTQKYSQMTDTRVSSFKGTKRVFVEVQSGHYTFSVLAKIPGMSSNVEHFVPKFVQFQLYAVSAESVPSRILSPDSLNYFGMLGPTGKDFGQFTYLLNDVYLQPREFIDLTFNISTEQESVRASIDVQAIEEDNKGDQLDISLREIHPEEIKLDDNQTAVNFVEKHPLASMQKDDFEDGIAYEALQVQDVKSNTLYRVRLGNRDPAETTSCHLKVVVTEKTYSQKYKSTRSILPSNFDEIARIKPKVPGIKEGSFIQGSKQVMDTFKVTSLSPFLPKSSQVYQAVFNTGKGTDDSFMKGIDFEVKQQSTQIYAQVFEYSGREDLFLSVYTQSDQHGEGQKQVARSSLGKYSNALGPVTLPKGKYRLMVHPDQDSSTLATGSELIMFGLDVLVERPSTEGGDFDIIVEEVELCNIQSLPDDFNGPGFLHPLSGNQMQINSKFRLAQLLESTTIKFQLSEPSLVTFYLAVPAGIKAEAALVRMQGTRTTKVSTSDLNKDDESFLRQDGGFKHRGVIQIREFLDEGRYTLKISGQDAASVGAKFQPRCESYEVSLFVVPLENSAKYPMGVECLDTQYVPEHLKFDERISGSLTYPVSESTVDVAYLDLKGDGEGPFLFFFELQYDPRFLGVIGLSLSKYDSEGSSFQQAAIYRSPQDGVTQVLAVVESGVYAVGIQTLTSTTSMFQDSGLGSAAQAQLQHKLLHESCLEVNYNYLVASTLKGDSRTLEGGAMGLFGLLAGGGLQKMASQQELDGKLLTELGDATILQNCAYDDFPSNLPQTESGFDRSFTLLTQEKPADFLDIVVERPSLLRVSVHSTNSKNQISAYLLEHPTSTEATAWTVASGTTATFIQLVKPQTRAYSLRVQYDSLDQDDACPTFDLRLILKPVEDAANANLHCSGDALPPMSHEITGDDFSVSGTYSFGSDFVYKATDQGDALEYDIALTWPNADKEAQYYLDAEAQSDVLTGQMTFQLLYQKADKSLGLLGRSHPVGSAAHGGRFTQRLKLLDHEGELAEDVNIDGAILRLRFPAASVHLFDVLRDEGHIGKREVCHGFSLSIRAELRSGENESGLDIMGQSRLIRVRWEGDEVDNGLFDPASRIYASLEFDRSMKAAFQLLKNTDFASLVADAPNVRAETVGTTPVSVKPAAKRLSAVDPSTILLEFHGGSLARGWCHKLQLHGSGGGIGPDFDTELIGADLKICGSNCLCNWKGTESCNEQDGHCTCKFPYVGADCGQCKPGHTLDPLTGECTIESMCASAGGKEDCNGHGECEQIGEQAVCHCNPGFVDDGLERCGKCSDPLFAYPDCQVRNWVLEEPDVDCKDLEYKMPRKLWKDAAIPSKPTPLQGADGEVNWAQRYRLNDGKAHRKSSSHYFTVPETSVFRLFLDTGRSGVKVKFRLLDDGSQELLSSASSSHDADSDGYLDSVSEFIVLHQPPGQESEEAPFKLKLEYKYDQHAREAHGQDARCPVIEVHLVTEPLLTAREALRCSAEELQAARAPRTPGWSFDYGSKFIQEEVTLSSEDSTLLKREGRENSHFATLSYPLDVRSSGNALSIVATYPFSELELSLALFDEKTGRIIQVERTASLEGERESGTALSAASDMASYVEVPWLEAGRYRLEIAVRRSLFLPTSRYPTCLAFGLVVEYVARPQGRRDDGMYDVLAVFPLSLQHLDPYEERVIEVMFDREVSLDDLVDGLPARLYVCQLVNTQDKSDKIHPRSVRTDGGSSLRLDFDFSQASIPSRSRCYTLQCSTQTTKGKEVIRPMQETTSYCFQNSEERERSAPVHCNPLAQPKLDTDGSCLCAAPYKGHDCESCMEGFTALVEKASPGSHDKKSHNRCVLDSSHTSPATCNSHGQPKSRHASSAKDVECECDQGYGGRYCDYCLDSSQAYPDCDSKLSSEIYDSEAAQAFLTRRKYADHGYSTTASKYFSEGALEPTVFNEECGWVDFPDDLDRAEIGREFSHGEFHLADLYVVNHKQDNIMKFVPRSTGVMKVLIQQPEAEEDLAGDAQAPFDIEVGIYDPRAQRFLASSMNRHLVLPRGTEAKLEYAAVSFEVSNDQQDAPLYIFFRALNFTDTADSVSAKDGCLALYIEMEFRSSPVECQRSQSLKPNSQVNVLRERGQSQLVADAARSSGEGAVYSVQDASSTFFTYQDYYVPAGSPSGQDEPDWEVYVSLQQKFVESNTLDILVEILATDIQLSEARPEAFSDRASVIKPSQSGLDLRHWGQMGAEEIRGSLGPTCAGACLVGGEKAFNEQMRRLELGAGTYFRVWLMQDLKQDRSYRGGSCANFQLLVSASPVQQVTEEQENEALHCQAAELPSTLNTHRYLLGLHGEQKDFHLRESYRVDHLWHNQAHSIKFKLQEPSVVRVVAPLHRHLDFVLILNQDLGPYSHKTVLTASKEDFHSTIFAQLAPGDYHLKLSFVSDAALLQVPCQTVQMEIAVMSVSNAKLRAEAIKEGASKSSTDQLTLTQLFLKSPSGPVTLYKPAALGWRHVEPGLPPYIDQRELYVEILREGFEISEEDDAGLDIEFNSDFLLAGVNVAISNTESGQVLENERHDSSGRLVIGHLQPGAYELIVYAHESITNMDPEHGVALSSFDLLLSMSVRLLKEQAGGQSKSNAASVPVELLEFSSTTKWGQQPTVKESSSAAPLVMSTEELKCFKAYLPLPDSFDTEVKFGQLDISERYYIPTSDFYSFQISYTAKHGADALRVLLARANSKLSLIEENGRRMVAQSKPSDSGKSQLLIAPQLSAGVTYLIILEFSQANGGDDNEASTACEHFVLAAKAWDSSKICESGTDLPDIKSVQTSISIGAEPTPQTFVLEKAHKKTDLQIQGSGLVDLTITADYSDAFYRPELVLRAASGTQTTSVNAEDEAAIDLMSDVEPEVVELFHKAQTTLIFRDIAAGTYQLRMRHRFKESGCRVPVTLTSRAIKAASTLSKGAGATAGNLFQSQAEEQEQPRTASKLPLNLGSYKFTGGESHSGGGATVNSGYLLFSGPVQLDEMESQNRITFEVQQDATLVRVYAEHSGLALTLRDGTSDSAKVLASGSGASLMRMLTKGEYAVQLSLASAHSRKSSQLNPPDAQLTIMVADADTHAYYNHTWEHVMNSKCSGEANFPLALRQQKQTDSHQLYYNYPLIKVSPSVLERSSVLQTYNFRVNVTSRMYFEVGMHLLNAHVSVQMTTLGSSGHAIQGKQRGNLNVLDVQVGPGDYSIAIKQVALPSGQYVPTCGLFSLQGLIEPINLMSAAANSGDILQRGISSCQGAANGDVLPPKIYGSKSLTRGGGELHVDATGHFMKRFHNVVFKQSREFGENSLEYDRVELEPVEDSLLHLTFLFEAEGERDVRVVLADTWMMGQEVTPQSSFKLADIEGGHVEKEFEYKLAKGRHYALTVFYSGGSEAGSRCALYDLTLSVSHLTRVTQETDCKAGKQYESLTHGLPHLITERDLDKDGAFVFDKVLRLQHPEDFKKLAKISEHGKTQQALIEPVTIDLDSNFDIRASVDFEYDVSLFTLEFTEEVKDETGGWVAEVSHEQSPLTFKRNDDHYKSVRREIVAEDVESESKSRKHTLLLVNRLPDLLSTISQSEGGRPNSCIYAHVKISIVASQRAAATLYSSRQRSSVTPTLVACRPDESPAFVHGRPNLVNFYLIFNTRPYLAHHSLEQKEREESIGEAIHLKATTVSIADGTRSDIHLRPASVTPSGKGYRNDEYHVAVHFDLSEFQHTATEKLLHAQLVLAVPQLEDSNGVTFMTEKKLGARGLPIYVFQEVDEEQLLKEEKSEVRQAIAGSELAVEAERELHEDVSVIRDDYSLGDMFSWSADGKVKCECAHGVCLDGKSTCSRCDSGWSGSNCDTPDSSEAYSHVNRNKQKDFTADGLYRPQQITDQRTSGSRERAHESRTETKRPQHIEADEPAPHTSLQEQVGPAHEYPTTAAAPGSEADEAPQTTWSNVIVMALIALVFYLLMNGVSLPSWPSKSTRKYKPIGAGHRDQDSDEEEDDLVSRRRMMELSSFGGAKEQKPSDDLQYHEAKQESSTTNFPLSSFDGQKEDEAGQLERELELFAQDDEEDSALINLGDEQREAASGRQPQSYTDDVEIAQLENYFEQEP